MNLEKNYAMVFPGQGSQSVGMVEKLAAMSASVQQCFEQASDELGYDLWKLVSEGPEADLNQTEKTQPALLTAGYATWQLWQQRIDNDPTVVAGHSLGEYTALVAAGVLDFAEAVKLVATRGRCMQEAVPAGVGAMAAVLGLEDAYVDKVCQESAADQVVAAANFNSPGQVVIAGHKEAVERAIEAAKGAGAKRAILLPVSVPSHSLLMQPAAEQFAEHLNQVTFSPARIPVVQNVDAQEKTDADSIRQCLIEQLYKPVRWVEVVQTIKARSVDCILEGGPGKVLAGLTKRIDRLLEIHCLQDEDSFTKATQA